VTLTLSGVTKRQHLYDVLRPGGTIVNAKGAFTVELEGYGYRWLRYQPDGPLPI
jgi:hypothetical protein